MIFGVSYFHLDPKYYFNVSYLVNTEISNTVNEIIFKPYGLDKVKEDWIFKFDMGTGQDVHELRVPEVPEITKKDKYINFAIKIPIDYILPNKDYQLDKYVDYVFEGLQIALSYYSIPVEVFIDAAERVKKTVLSDEKFRYKHNQIRLTDEDIIDLLGYLPE